MLLWYTTERLLKCKGCEAVPSKKSSKGRSIIYFLIPFFITVAVFAGVAFLAKDFIAERFLGGGDGGTKQSSSQQVNLPSETLLSEANRAGTSYLNDIIFVGDSRTNGMAGNDFVPESQVFAEDGINHKDIQKTAFIKMSGVKKTMTLEEAVKLKRPPIIMVSLGINGVAFMAEDEFMKEYENLINLLQKSSPNSQIIIQSIFPVSTAKEQSDTRMTNKKIDSYNQKLLQLAGRENCYFLDSAQSLKNSKNALDSKYDSGDGLHLSKQAYEVIFDYILTHPLILN